MPPFLKSDLITFLLILFISYSISVSLSPQGVNADNHILDVTPVPIPGLSGISSEEIVSCARIAVSGLSRLRIGSLHSIQRVTLVPSVVIPEKLHSKIQICFHRNYSLGSCQCEEDDWRSLHNGVWRTIISPYDDRYIDLKFIDDIPGSATVTVEVEYQKWRLFCLALGIVLWLLAPMVSCWVPFYYSSSMAIGVLLVIIIILFQGMKLLPTGRKNVFYLVIYGSLLSAGSFLLHQLSVLVNSILLRVGLSDEMHSSVTVFLLVFIVLAGAGLGYWIVRKFVVTEDGSVDVGIGQFVKWAIRIIGVTSISQSTHDTPLAVVLVCCCMVMDYLIKFIRWRNFSESPCSVPNVFLPNSGRSNMKHQHTESYSRSRMGARGLRSVTNSSSRRSDYTVRGSSSPSTCIGTTDQEDFYSTFHTTPARKNFSKVEWDKFTQQAVSELGASPEFSCWVTKNACRVELLPEDNSEDSLVSGIQSSPEDYSDDSLSNGPGSSDESAIESSSGICLFKRHGHR